MKSVMQTSSDSSWGALDRLDLSESRWLRAEDEETEEEEDVPTHLNTNMALQFLVISADKLSARYTGEGRHEHDVGAIQGNCPAPFKRLLYYFEIEVKEQSKKGVISIGFTDENFKPSRHVGWEPNSYGYHGDDGKLFVAQGIGSQFGPTFASGDTVGAGINYATQKIFFTKNGKLVGTCPKDVKSSLYPSIGLHSPNERVDVNFGQRSFVFDIEALARQERERRQKAIESITIPLVTTHSIVRAYLIHYGYQDTLLAFDAANGNAVNGVASLPCENGNEMVGGHSYALCRRKILRQARLKKYVSTAEYKPDAIFILIKLARNGDIDGVFSHFAEWYPQLLQDRTSTLYFLLHCQKFIELIKNGSLEMAIAYAQAELSQFYETMVNKFPLQECLALLAYEHPEESSLGYLLKLEWRERLADAINSAVLALDDHPPLLANKKKPPQSSLESLLKQLSVCFIQKLLLNNGQGEAFSLRRLLQ